MKFLFRLFLIQNLIGCGAIVGLLYVYKKKNPAAFARMKETAQGELRDVAVWTWRFGSTGDMGDFCKKQKLAAYPCFFLYTKKEKNFLRMSPIGLASLWSSGVRHILETQDTAGFEAAVVPEGKKEQLAHWTQFVLNDLGFAQKFPSPMVVLIEMNRMLSESPERSVSGSK